MNTAQLAARCMNCAGPRAAEDAFCSDLCRDQKMGPARCHGPMIRIRTQDTRELVWWCEICNKQVLDS